MSELQQLRYFIAVAEHRHFTRAAERLLVAQPALSQQIRALERRLGVALLERSSRQVTLTGAGEALLPAARAAVRSYESALDEARSRAGVLSGRVCLGAWQSMQVGLPDLLAAFRHGHPAVDVEVVEVVSREMVASVRSGALDAAMIVQQPGLVTAGLHHKAFGTEPYELAVGPNHALAGRRRVGLAELAEEPFVLHRRGSAVRETILDACAQTGFRPRIALETLEMSAARAFVAAGLGITILPHSSLLSPGPPVRRLQISSPTLTRTSVLIWPATRSLGSAAAAFVAFAQENLGLLVPSPSPGRDRAR